LLPLLKLPIRIGLHPSAVTEALDQFTLGRPKTMHEHRSGPYSPLQDPQAQVVPNCPQNRSGPHQQQQVRPVQRAKIVKNTRAKVVKNVRVQVRPEQNAQAQDRSVQNAQAQKSRLVQSTGRLN
jgi:hypothetical protein